MTIHILSLHRLSEKQQAQIRTARPDIELSVADAKDCGPFLSTAEVLLAFGQTDLTPILPAAPKLRWIHALTAGVDQWLALDALRQSDLLLTNSRGIHGIPIAEHVLGMILCHSRCLLTAHDNQKERKWAALKGIDELGGKTALIAGLGSVGGEIARHLKAMDMRVIGVKRTKTKEPFVDEVHESAALEQLLPDADFVIVTLPLLPETTDLFSWPLFQKMKPSAGFINVARGPIVNEADLVRALEEKEIGWAALDVFQKEPLPEDSPLWSAPNLMITPHHAASSPRYMERAVALFIENLRQYPQAEKMRNIIDKERGY